jgi:hypothetical protein
MPEWLIRVAYEMGLKRTPVVRFFMDEGRRFPPGV